MRVRGSAHITEDFDFCYARTTENIAALAAALAPLHPYLRGAPPGLPFKLNPPTIQAGLNFTLESDCGDIDLLGEVKGIGTFEQVLAQSDVRVVYGVPIHVLTLNGLIISKKAAARYKDHGHIVELNATLIVDAHRTHSSPPRRDLLLAGQLPAAGDWRWPKSADRLRRAGERAKVRNTHPSSVTRVDPNRVDSAPGQVIGPAIPAASHGSVHAASSRRSWRPCHV